MSSSEQLKRNGDTPASEMNQTQSRGLGGGTDVMGEPANHTSNLQEQGSAGDVAKNSPSSARSYPYPPTDAPPPTDAGSHESATPYAHTTTDSHASVIGSNASVSPSSATTGFPSARTADSSTAGAHQSATATQTPSPSPYVHTSSIPGGTGKTPMDSIMQVFNKWSKKAEDVTGDVWNHLKTGPNIADTAMGRIAVGTKAMTEGGLENVFRQTFEVVPEERLLKSYACYLSTSTGPVAGTLYISSHKLAFCSDRPLAIPGSSQPPSSMKSTPSSNTSSSTQQQEQRCFYKVMVPVGQLEAVNPLENTQKRPAEKYVQVKTVDGHEFWFMGFVHYDKGVKNLQETLLNKNAAPSSIAPPHDDKDVQETPLNKNAAPSYNASPHSAS